MALRVRFTFFLEKQLPQTALVNVDHFLHPHRSLANKSTKGFLLKLSGLEQGENSEAFLLVTSNTR